ncbi:hypothetical protein PAXRUDRAFT_547420 [Paxillus rubicundulus Ve08.2h10]|uniref:Uncharacterized protein n=1 Tax=Paxillus rubicundulus Ve08.2h10 TaxID=930991 RepID=A0A0D0DW12_9AGAM|nr:hypothetical protein PAXRUDRAFT_547420 [Paxillus rubicundulus Ve08.2h10]
MQHFVDILDGISSSNSGRRTRKKPPTVWTTRTLQSHTFALRGGWSTSDMPHEASLIKDTPSHNKYCRVGELVKGWTSLGDIQTEGQQQREGYGGVIDVIERRKDARYGNTFRSQNWLEKVRRLLKKTHTEGSSFVRVVARTPEGTAADWPIELVAHAALQLCAHKGPTTGVK